MQGDFLFRDYSRCIIHIVCTFEIKLISQIRLTGSVLVDRDEQPDRPKWQAAVKIT